MPKGITFRSIRKSPTIIQSGNSGASPDRGTAVQREIAILDSLRVEHPTITKCITKES